MRSSFLVLALSAVALSTSTSRCRDADVSAILDSFSCGQPSIRQQCVESSANLPITGLVQCLTTSGCRRTNDQIMHMPVTCDSEGESVGPTEIRNRRSDYGHGRRIIQRQLGDINTDAAATTDSSPTTQDQAAATSQSFGTTVTVQPSATSSTSSRAVTTITVPASSAVSTSSSSTSSKTSSASTSTATSNSSSAKIGTSGIVVAAIFGLIVLCSIIFVIFINVRRSRRSRLEAQRESTAYHALITPPEAKHDSSSNMYSKTTLAGSSLGQEHDPESQSTYYHGGGHRDIPLETVQAGRSFSNERYSMTRSTSANLHPMENPYDPYNAQSHARHDSISGVTAPPRAEAHTRSTSSSPPSARPQSRGPAPPLPSANISYANQRPGSYAAARHTRSSSSISSQSGLARQFSFSGGNPADISRESSRATASPAPRLHVRTDSSGAHMVPTILTPASPPY